MSTLSHPFRFPDLPKELRLLVYEHIDVSTKQYKLSQDKTNTITLHSVEEIQEQQFKTSEQHAQGTDAPSITLTTHTLPVQILATCRLINAEATPILQRHLTKLKHEVPRIVLAADCLYTPLLHGPDGLLCALLEYLQTRSRNPKVDVYTFKSTQPKQLGQVSPTTVIHKWIAQTATTMLSQASSPPTSTPLFASSPAYPLLRIILLIHKTWPSTLPSPSSTSPLLFDGHCGMSPFHKAWQTYSVPTTISTPPIYTISTGTQLTNILNATLKVVREKHWDRVKSGSVVFGEDRKRQMGYGGLEVVRVCAMEWEVDV